MKKAAVSSILVAVVLLALAVTAEAQQAGKVARIGFLDRSTSSALQVSPFLQELSKLGWVEGKNITFEYRFAEGKLTAYLSLRRNWPVLRLMSS
jgi:hypothetical protein